MTELFARIAATGLLVAIAGIICAFASIEDTDPRQRLERAGRWMVRLGFALVFVGAIGMVWTA